MWLSVSHNSKSLCVRDAKPSQRLTRLSAILADSPLELMKFQFILLLLPMAGVRSMRLRDVAGGWAGSANSPDSQPNHQNVNEDPGFNNFVPTPKPTELESQINEMTSRTATTTVPNPGF